MTTGENERPNVFTCEISGTGKVRDGRAIMKVVMPSGETIEFETNAEFNLDGFFTDAIAAIEKARKKMRELTAADYYVSDMEEMFVAIRSANVRGKLWPVEIALLGIKDGDEYVWSSPIYPALSWPRQIIDLSEIDLRDSPPATDVARETLERISRASGKWCHAEDPQHTKKLLDRLLDEANLGFTSDEAVIPVDVEWGRDGAAAGGRVREYLVTHPALLDPVEQVQRLSRAWAAGYS
ncbi:hypothetical protein FGK63_20400 [Ruegeria sediminis]|uniref:Uncharacterized protein n=1 Tax=Ruegeria sediminis TaxID=2583820 RepID=A0ABY2WSY0_9RHOB|nr:hypothetical protein [Ruegeria sediminis]TMV02591.1 hypothetical protein FGK63_20400 [Ruegeria sediminis]